MSGALDVQIIPAAERQIADVERWWAANRPSARGAVEEELVTVLAEDGGTFELTPEQERVLEGRIAEADLGEKATWAEVLEVRARRSPGRSTTSRATTTKQSGVATESSLDSVRRSRD